MPDEIHHVQPIGSTVPANARPGSARCSRCDEDIWWLLSGGGILQPFTELDGGPWKMQRDEIHVRYIGYDKGGDMVLHDCAALQS